MFALNKHINRFPERPILGFDLEWTKNFRIRHGNQPFCFSFVYVDGSVDPAKAHEDIEFGVEARYVSCVGEINRLNRTADRLLSALLRKAKEPVVVGHQLSSDISVMLATKDSQDLKAITALKEAWQMRKDRPANHHLKVFDTRYDLGAILMGTSRRLVDVCTELGLDVTQPELSQSMTRMQTEFYCSKDRLIRERLMIMNIRHSLSAVLLRLLIASSGPLRRNINVNKIIYRNLEGLGRFQYLEDKSFRGLLHH